MKLRRLNSDGLGAFGDFLRQARQTPDAELPPGLLDSSALTEIISPEIQIAPGQFETKGEAARYLSPILGPIPADAVSRDAGLWTWLTILYFDSVCPVEQRHRDVKNDYHYVYQPENVRHFYRHLLYISWRVLHLAPFWNRLFLTSRLSTLDKVTTEVMKRLYLTRVPCMFEVLDRLYWDETRRRPRSGVTGSKARAGDLTRRFPQRIRQLEMTYDLMSLTADQLIELLGEEFAFARPAGNRLFPARP